MTDHFLGTTLASGMTADEIQAAIDRAEDKRRELEAQQPRARESAKVLSMLPRAAEKYRRSTLRIAAVHD